MDKIIGYAFAALTGIIALLMYLLNKSKAKVSDSVYQLEKMKVDSATEKSKEKANESQKSFEEALKRYNDLKSANAPVNDSVRSDVPKPDTSGDES